MSVLFNIEDAAKKLATTKRALYQRIYAGEIAYVKTGAGRNGRIYVVDADLDAYIEKHRIESFK